MTRTLRSVGARAAAVLLAASAAVLAAPLVGLAHADGLPYTDPAALGSITFCDKDGQPVTSGSLDDKPFAYRAIGSAAAPAPYDGAGRTATLLAFQPRGQVAPAQWSGELITASSRYTLAAHPTAAVTGRDLSLGDVVADYPLQVDGLLQLRIYLGVPDQPTYKQTYSATNLRVSGKTWTAVDPGHASCTDSGSSISIEDVLKLPSATPVAVAPAAVTSSGAPISSHPTTSSAPAAAAAGSTPPAQAAPIASSTAVDAGSSAAQNAVVLLLVLAAVAGVGWYLVSRRRSGDGL